MNNLTLYYFDSCPFCQKVLKYMKENSIKLSLRNTSTDPSARAELIKTGGKAQVPCLVIDGKALYESDDIITWLKANYTGA